MACERRIRYGFCNHDQCPFPYDTQHGYECIDIFDGQCECGADCLPQCKFSFSTKSPEEYIREKLEEAYSLIELCNNDPRYRDDLGKSFDDLIKHIKELINE
jgi:hypothetical protein